MARLFDPATPDFLQFDGVAPLFPSAPPFTVAAWFRVNDASAARVIWWHGDASVTSTFYAVIARPAGDGRIIRVVIGSANLETVASYTDDVWTHVLWAEATTTDHRIFVDGVKFSSGDLRNLVGAPIDRTAIGMNRDSTPGNPFSGDIGHVAVWSVALSDGEAISLADGASPFQIRPDSLADYWPLNGRSPELDVVANAQPLTLNGAPTVSDEPDTLLGRAIVAP